MSDFEYTVVEPFTLPIGDQGRVKVFQVGEHISDPAHIKAVEERFSRQVARHPALPKPAAKPAVTPAKAD